MTINKICKRLIEDEIISEEDKEVIEFGVTGIVERVFAIFVFALVGFLFKSINSGMLLWLFINPLRRYAGGYHASSRINCTLVSLFLISFVYILFQLVNFSQAIYVVIFAICNLIIFLIAPVDTPNKKLEEIEYIVYKKRTRKILLLEDMLYAYAYVFQQKTIANLIIIGYVIVAILVSAGAIKMGKFYKEQ